MIDHYSTYVYIRMTTAASVLVFLTYPSVSQIIFNGIPCEQLDESEWWLRSDLARPPRVRNTKEYSSTYLAMGFANVRAGTNTRRGVFGYPPEH